MARPREVMTLSIAEPTLVQQQDVEMVDVVVGPKRPSLDYDLLLDVAERV